MGKQTIEQAARELVEIKGRISEANAKRSEWCEHHYYGDRETGDPGFPGCRFDPDVPSSKWCKTCQANKGHYETFKREKRNYYNCFRRLQTAVKREGAK